jgi:hypothetical protein
MRFYDIVIRQNGKVFHPDSMQGMGFTDVSYSSLTSSRLPNPSALDLYIDIPAFFMSAPRQGAMIRLSGISLKDIAQVTHLVDADIEVYAGMLDGYLPLAKHFSPDLLTKGLIWQTSGNWEPNNTTLDIYITTPTTRNPALGTGARANLAFEWPVGQPLKSALQKFLDQAYGKSSGNPNGATITLEISDQLIARAPFVGNYGDFTEFCQQLKRFTQDGFRTIKRLDNAPYRGVELFWRNNTIYAVDGTQPPSTGSSTHTEKSPLEIKFEELIGQPGWKTFNELVFKTIMRGDIALADYIKLPSTLASPYVLTGGGGQQAPNDQLGMGLPSKNSLTFSGTFQVQEVRHVGQFRQATGLSWTTTVDCFVPAATTVPDLLTPAVVEPMPGEDRKTTLTLPSTPANPLNTGPPRVPPPSTTVLPPFQVVPPFPQ